MNLKTSLPPLALIPLFSLLQAASFSYDFNSGLADYNSHFNSTDSGEWSSAGVPSWAATGGVNNSGRIQSGGNNNTAVLRSASDFSSVGSSNRVSTWFEARLNASGLIDGFNALGVGFTIGDNGTLNSNQYVAAELEVQGGNQVLSLRYRDSFTVNTPDSDALSLVSGNWYKLENVVTKEAGVGNFSFDISLTDYGADGNGAGIVVDTYSTGTLGGMSTLWNETELNAAFQGYSQGGAGGAFGFDNFEATVIPEPATFSLLSLAGLLFFMQKRRA